MKACTEGNYFHSLGDYRYSPSSFARNAPYPFK